MKFVAIDVGSSFMKAALLDTESLELHIQREIEMPRANTGKDNLCYEIDADCIYQRVKQVIDELIEANGSDIRGITISTQMHGFVFCDEGGRAKTPYVSWQDNRCLRINEKGQTYLQELESILSQEEMRSNGLYLKPGLGFCNAYTAVKQNTFQIDNGDYFCTLGAYLIFNLTKERKCHITNAAPLGLVDVKQGCWNQNIIHKLQFDRFQLFDLVSDTTICGYYHGSYGDVAVYPDWGDQQVAVLGSFMNAITDVNINVATASQLGYISNEFNTGAFETRPYFEGLYLNTVTRMPNGKILDVVVNFVEDIGTRIYQTELSRQELWSRIFGAVEVENSVEMTCDVGFIRDLLGTKQGYFGNITDQNFTVGNLFRSVFTTYANIFDTYLNFIVSDKAKLQRIVYTGGAILKNPYLQKAIREKIGVSDFCSPIKCEVFLGHLRLALVCDGKAINLSDTANILYPDKKLQCKVIG